MNQLNKYQIAVCLIMVICSVGIIIGMITDPKFPFLVFAGFPGLLVAGFITLTIMYGGTSM